MIFNLLNLLIGFSLLIITMAIIVNYIRYRKVNFFFFLLLLLAGLARFQYGLTTFGFIHESKPLVFRIFILLFIFPPIYYLCLNSFISVKTTWTKMLLHFVFFFIIVLGRIYFGAIEIKLLGIIFSVYALFYYYLLIRSSLFYFRQHQSIYTKQQLLKVKQLIVWIFSLSLNNFIFTAYFILFNTTNKSEAIDGMFHSTSIVWVLFLIYLFLNPSIIFNEIFKKRDPNRDFIQEFGVWNTRAFQKIEFRDSTLEQIIRKNLEKLILDLKQLPAEAIIASNSTHLLQELAVHLNYPKSHLKYALKYHCQYSQSDYLNLMRVIYALQLMNNGFLENYTIETLVDKCHFNSRTSFYRHFKRHLGVSPSKYKALID